MANSKRTDKFLVKWIMVPRDEGVGLDFDDLWRLFAETPDAVVHEQRLESVLSNEVMTPNRLPSFILEFLLMFRSGASQ